MSRSNRSPIKLAPVATRLAEQREIWEPLIKFDPLSRYYARLARERDFEAWLLTWLPGQGTNWHDHGGSAGAFITLCGTLMEEYAMVRPDGPPTILAGARTLGAGALRQFGTKHVHRVTNNDLVPAVSLHVYAPSLVEMNSYTAEGDLLRLSDSQLVGLNW